MKDKQAIALANSVIMVANKFIHKVETGRARSQETYSDLLKLKAEAELFKLRFTDYPSNSPT